MSGQFKIRVFNIIGSPLGISAEDGTKIFKMIVSPLKEGHEVTVCFDEMEMLISLFLNVAIGQLYDGSIDQSLIEKHLKFEGLSPDDQELLDLVIENAKRYYAKPKDYDLAWQAEVGDEE